MSDQPAALPASHTVLEHASTNPPSSILSFSPTPAEKELMKFDIGLRLLGEIRRERYLTYLKHLRDEAQIEKGESLYGIQNYAG